MVMPLAEFMKLWSHREYLTRLAWLDAQWNKPSRLEYYLMQIAQEVRRVLSKKPKLIKLKDFLINFGGKKNEKVDYQKTVLASKMTWLAPVMGMWKKMAKAVEERNKRAESKSNPDKAPPAKPLERKNQNRRNKR